MPQPEDIIHQMAEFHDAFHMGDIDDSQYFEQIMQHSRGGHMATLYVKSSCHDARMPKDLQQVVKQWEHDLHNPFQYQIDRIPEKVSQNAWFMKSIYAKHDRLLTIMGMNVQALAEEVQCAKQVLVALGLRDIGPKPEQETFRQITTHRLASEIRKSVQTQSMGISANAGLPVPASTVSAHMGVQQSHHLENHQSTAHDIDYAQDLPVGATREWMFLKAIAIAAGVPKQPADFLNLYRKACNDRNPPNFLNQALWDVSEEYGDQKKREEPVNEMLKDAKAVRGFLHEQLDGMYERFSNMQKGQTCWGIEKFSHIQNPEERDQKNKQVFGKIAQAIAGLRVEADHTLAGSVDGDSTENGLFDRLEYMREFCKSLGGIPWAEKAFDTMAYTAELVSIMDRGALFFQQETVRRINAGTSCFPEPVATLIRNKTIILSGGYNQRVEGRMIKPGVLPAGFSEEFPCVENEKGEWIMVPSAKVEKNLEKSCTILVVPPIPDNYPWTKPADNLALSTASDLDALDMSDFYEDTDSDIEIVKFSDGEDSNNGISEDAQKNSLQIIDE